MADKQDEELLLTEIKEILIKPLKVPYQQDVAEMMVQGAINQAEEILTKVKQHYEQESEALRELIRRLTARCEQLRGEAKEAKKQGYDEGVKDKLGLEDALIAGIGKLKQKIKEAKREERERIINLVKQSDVLCDEDTNCPTCKLFWQALKKNKG